MNEYYYLLLGLSVERYVSGQEAMTAAEKKLKEWNANTNPQEQAKAQKYKKPFTEAIANEAEWKQHYEAAKKKVDEVIDGVIMVRRSKGYITTDEIETMAKGLKINTQIKSYSVSVGYVTDMVKKKGVSIVPAGDSPAAKEEGMTLFGLRPKGEFKLKQTATPIFQLGCGSLYDVLEKYQEGSRISFTEETSAGLCVETAKKIKEVWRVKKPDAEQSAVTTVCTQIIGHFDKAGDPENQEEYNRYLVYSRVKEILDELKSSFKGAEVRMIDDTVKGIYTSRIIELLPSRKDAESILSAYCEENDIRMPAKLAIHGVCPFCNSTFEKKGGETPETCPHCNRSFLLPCPKCKKQVNFAEKRSCCGFNFDQYPRMKNKCNEASVFIASLNFEFAEQRLGEVERIWPGFPELSDLKSDLAQKKKESGKLIDSLKKCISEHRIQAANREYQALKKAVSGYSDPAIEEQIDSAVKEANSFYQAAKAAKDSNTKLQNLIKVTEIVADHADALRELGNLKPDPVTRLSCTVVQEAGNANLKWESSNPDGTAVYMILRKAHSVPVSTEDGRIAQTGEHAYCDSSMKPGVPYFYAVYAVRGSNKTQLQCTSAPVMIFPVIKSPHVAPDESSVQVTWTQDVGDLAAEVFRCTSPAEKQYGKGDRVKNVTQNSFSDTGLSVGSKYYYNIFLTRTVGGTKLISPPFSLTVSPVKVSKPMEFTLQQSEDLCIMTLARNPEADEKIAFYESPRMIDIPEDGVISVPQLIDRLHLTPVKTEKESPVRYSFHPGRNSKGYLYVVSIRGETAVIGSEDYYENLEMIGVQMVQSDGLNLHITLDAWPAGVKTMYVCYRTDRFPSSPSESEGNKFSVNDLTYKSSKIVVPQKQNTCFYIVGFVRGGNGYTAVFRKKYGEDKVIDVKYHFQTVFLSKKLVIQLSEPAELPEIAVCYKEQFPPGNAEDGQQIMTVSSTDQKKSFTFDLPKIKGRRGVKQYVKLFLKDRSLTGRYSVMVADGHTPEL